MPIHRRSMLALAATTAGLAGCTAFGEQDDDADDGAGDGDGGAGDGDGGGHPAAADEPSESAEVAMSSDDGHHFEPHLVWIETGGTVTWRLESGAHSTTAYHGGADRPDRLPAAAEGWDSGTLTESDATFEQTFDEPGVYDYFCVPHESMGMVGTVVVGDPDPDEEPALEPPQEDLPADARDAIGDLNDAAEETLANAD